MFGSDLQKVEKLVAKKNSTKLMGYLNSKDEAVRLAAIVGLGKTNDENAFNSLTSLLSSDNAGERAAAAEALGEMGMERASTFISHVQQTETDEKAKEAMGKAIGKLRKHMD